MSKKDFGRNEKSFEEIFHPVIIFRISWAKNSCKIGDIPYIQKFHRKKSLFNTSLHLSHLCYIVTSACSKKKLIFKESSSELWGCHIRLMAIIGLKLTSFFVAMLCIIIPAATNCLTLISWSRFTARESIRRVNHTSVFAIIFVEIIRNNIFVFWSAKETSKQLPQAIGSGYLDFHLTFFSFWK